MTAALDAIRARDAEAASYDLRPRDPAKATLESLLADYWRACVDRLALLAALDRAEAVVAAAREWAESDGVVRATAAPTREEWNRALAAREALRAALADVAGEVEG